MNSLKDQSININHKDKINNEKIDNNIYRCFKDTILPEYMDEYNNLLILYL